MARKRIADKEPVISNEGGAAAASAKAPNTSNKARAPRASANSQIHRHKVNANSETESEPTLAEQAISATGAPQAVAPSIEPPIAAAGTAVALSVEPLSIPATPAAPPRSEQRPAHVAPIAHEEIEIRAYLLAEGRGFQGGSVEDDWLTAERQLRAERQTQ